MDPFDTLGLEARFDLDVKEIEARYRDLLRTLHPDKHVQAGALQRRESLSRSVDVNDAYRVLKDDLSRAKALLQRHGGKANESGRSQDPELLMEVMELREALAEAKAARDVEAARKLSAQVQKLESGATAVLQKSFTTLQNQESSSALESAQKALTRLTYYRRFQDEVASIEEDALG